MSEGLTEVYKKRQTEKSALVGKQHRRTEEMTLERDGYKSEKQQQ